MVAQSEINLDSTHFQRRFRTYLHTGCLRLEVMSSQMALNVGRCMGQGRRSPLLHQKRARYSILHKGTKTGTALKTKSHCSLFKPPLSCEARGRNLHLPGTAVHRLLNESRYVQARVGLRWRLSQLDTSQWFLLLLNIPGGTTLSILVSLSCSFTLCA